MNTQLDAVNVPGCATAESSRRDMAGPGRTVPPAPVARIVRIDVPSRRRQRRRKGVGLHTERSERAIRFTISPDRVTLVYGAVQVDRLVGSEPRRLTDIGVVTRWNTGMGLPVTGCVPVLLGSYSTTYWPSKSVGVPSTKPRMRITHRLLLFSFMYPIVRCGYDMCGSPIPR